VTDSMHATVSEKEPWAGTDIRPPTGRWLGTDQVRAAGDRAICGLSMPRFTDFSKCRK
jgi:hypothetical protein